MATSSICPRLVVRSDRTSPIFSVGAETSTPILGSRILSRPSFSSASTSVLTAFEAAARMAPGSVSLLDSSESTSITWHSRLASGYGPSRPRLSEPRTPDSTALSAGGYLCSTSLSPGLGSRSKCPRTLDEKVTTGSAGGMQSSSGSSERVRGLKDSFTAPCIRTPPTVRSYSTNPSVATSSPSSSATASRYVTAGLPVRTCTPNSRLSLSRTISI
mmetsp:Transcript_35524/g.79745  ORF Transcript_35524/g.79745 Transcript_35524/m.79745 type:complete len:216 (+) Transcript_35524:384-1031(+)